MTETWAKTACILCECNCGLEVQVVDRALLKIRGDKDHPESQGYTCEKPLRLDRYQNGPHRITSPMRRNADGGYDEISWETALDEIASRLAEVRDEHGGASIGYYGGGGQGNHLGGAYGRSLMNAVGMQYYSNALAQEKTGEPWIDSQIYGQHTSGDYENAEVSVFIGKNPWQSHGVARARPTLKEIARDPARAMIVIDPRRSETAELADIHLQVRPGGDAWCLAAMVATLVQEDLVDHDFLDAHTVGAERILLAYARIDIDEYAARAGVDPALVRAAARRIAAAKSVSTYEDLGLQHSPNATVNSYIQKMLWILTGNFAKPGGMHVHSWLTPIVGKWHPVDGPRRRSGQKVRRSVGLAAMAVGAAPLRSASSLAARGRGGRVVAGVVADTALATFFDAVAVDIAGGIAEKIGMRTGPDRTPVTGARILSGLIPASSYPDEILNDHPGRIRGLWIDASNPVHSLPDSKRWREAMAALELSVVIDVAMTETARCADYVLPASSQFEKWEASLFTLHFPHNAFQLRPPVMEPLDGTRPEAEIYAAVIDRLGVVPQRVLDDLTAAARISPAAYALAFFATLHQHPEWQGLATYLMFRTLGPALVAASEDGDERRAQAAGIWGMCQLAAIAQPDGLARAGFEARGFAQGQELFEAVLAHPEGVTFTEDSYDDAWGYVQHPDRKFRLVIPELLAELAALAGKSPETGDAEFPLVLMAGERRAFTANVIIRDPSWRRRDAAGALRMSAQDAEAYGVSDGERVRLVTRAGRAEVPVEISDRMQPGHVSLPNGMGVSYPGADGDEVTGVPLNELTGILRRDPFFGSPWHKHVPARVERL